ncbi:MAG: HNH endonuclease signature motif containing protein, partial [Jatrophihabitans sp.]
IIARDQTCTFTSCTRPAVACDLDHRVSAKDGGTTCPGNLHPLCRRHHRCKHQTDWLPERQPDGSTIWTSPTGHEFRTQPDPLPTTIEPDVPEREAPPVGEDPDPPPF